MSHWKILKDLPDAPYFLTLTVAEWSYVFTLLPYFELVVESLRYCQKNKQLRLFAYVIMLNHIHLIAAGDHNHLLSEILRDFKRFTASEIISLLHREGRQELLEIFAKAGSLDGRGRDHKVWIEGNHPVLIESAEFFRQKLNYLHENPVRKGLVERPEHWAFSSARNYLLSDSSVLEVELMEC